MGDYSLPHGFSEWLPTVPSAFRCDPLWKLSAYRLARFAADTGWEHVTILARDRRTVSVSNQLCRALGSICANLAEGYSRSSGADRVRLYEYALGSARESREWYRNGMLVLGEEETAKALDVLTKIVKLLLVYIPDQRRRVVRKNLPAPGRR